MNRRLQSVSARIIDHEIGSSNLDFGGRADRRGRPWMVCLHPIAGAGKSVRTANGATVGTGGGGANPAWADYFAADV
ncbi:MAG: hypothetical protein ACYS4T_19255 [Planctomycetota bacterium]